jgi:hypothetical protein
MAAEWRDFNKRKPILQPSYQRNVIIFSPCHGVIGNTIYSSPRFDGEVFSFFFIIKEGHC